MVSFLPLIRSRLRSVHCVHLKLSHVPNNWPMHLAHHSSFIFFASKIWTLNKTIEEHRLNIDLLNTSSRCFNMSTINQYALDRNYSAASRLGYQFFLWINTFKFNLHPSIPTPNGTARIADVAPIRNRYLAS